MQTEAWNSVAQNVDFNLEIDLAEFKILVPTDTHILDYGCGYGRTCNILKSNGFLNVIGCDSSSSMISRGNHEYPNMPLFQNANIRLEYPPNHFGAIILCAVLTCVPEYKEKVSIIKEAQRLLKPTGVIHVVEFCSDHEKTFETEFGVKMNHQEPSELRDLLMEFTKELKFEIVQVKTMSGRKAEAVSYFGKNIT